MWLAGIKIAEATYDKGWHRKIKYIAEEAMNNPPGGYEFDIRVDEDKMFGVNKCAERAVIDGISDGILKWNDIRLETLRISLSDDLANRIFDMEHEGKDYSILREWMIENVKQTFIEE